VLSKQVSKNETKPFKPVCLYIHKLMIGHETLLASLFLLAKDGHYIFIIAKLSNYHISNLCAVVWSMRGVCMSEKRKTQ